MTDTIAAKPIAKKKKDIMSRIPAGFVRAVLRGHSSLGLAFAALIYLICLTGSLAVFAHEYQRWESATAPTIYDVRPAAIQKALEGAVARGGAGVEHAYITLPSPDLPRMQVYVDGKNERNFMADADGNLIEGQENIWTEFITRLHINLHLPQTWGGFLVGLIGVALLSSLISGILAHPRIFRDAFHLRIGGSKRLQEADFHNRLGIWALPFHIVISATGALLGLTTIVVGVLGFVMFNGDVGKVYAIFLPEPPIDDPRPAPVIDLLPMIAKLPENGGKLGYIFIEHPKEVGGAAMFNIEHPDRLVGTDSYAFKRDATIYDRNIAAENNLGEDVLNSMGPLHFGWFGGGLVKIVYLLLGLGLTYLAASGVYIWLARRRDKGRPAPGWEKAWAATVWGQPAGIAAAALTAVVMPQINVLIGVWLIVSVVFYLASFKLPPQALSLAGRIGIGLLMIATAIAHVAVNGGAILDPIAWVVDAVLLVIGAAFLASALRNRRQRAEQVTEPLPA